MVKICTLVESAPAHVCIDPSQQVLHNNFHKNPRYEGVPQLVEAIDFAYGLGEKQGVPRGAQGRGMQDLEEMQKSPSQEQAVRISTVKCRADAKNVERSQQVEKDDVQNYSTSVD